MNPTPSQLNHAIAAAHSPKPTNPPMRSDDLRLDYWKWGGGKTFDWFPRQNWAGDPAAAALLLDEMTSNCPPRQFLSVDGAGGLWRIGWRGIEGDIMERLFYGKATFAFAVARAYCEWNPAARAALEALINEANGC